MPIVNSSSASGDSTFALTNGSTTGRMLVVLAVQDRSPANLEGFTFDGVSGTVYGLQTTASGNDRTLAVVWTDSQLPASAGTYNLTRNTGVAGGTSYGIVELSGMDDGATVEVVSNSVLSTTDPLSLTFTNSADAFLGMSLETKGSQASATVTGGSGQTDFYASNESIATGKIDSAPDNTLTVSTFNAADEVAYTGISIEPLATGPSLTAPASISPGASGQFTVTGLAGAPTSATVSDGTSTLTLTNIALVSGDTYSFDTPALPAVGASLQYTTFGSVTMTVGDGTSTTQDTTSLVTSAHPITTLGATFDTGELSWLYNFTPDPAPIEQGDQGTPQTAGITLGADGGYVADEDGTYVITAIDATDGIAQSYELIVGPAAATAGRLTRRNLTRRTLTRRSLTARP